MHAIRFRPLPMALVPAIAVLAATGMIAPTALAQERRTFGGELDPKTVVVFEDSASALGVLHKAISPDGKLRAETGFRKLRVYSVGNEQLLHEFETTDSATAPHFSADGKTVYAAVSRGNLASISTIYSWNLTTGKRKRWGECRGIVREISSDADGKRIAVTSPFWLIEMLWAEREDRWIGGEMVVFDADHPDSSVLIQCELPGIPSAKQWRQKAKEKGSDKEEMEEAVANLQKMLADAHRRSVPIRVGLTPDGKHIIGVTYTGNVRVFSAETGQPELILNAKGRGGPSPISAAKTE